MNPYYEILPVQGLLRATQISATVLQALASESTARTFKAYASSEAQLQSELDKLYLHYIMGAFAQIGWQPVIGDSITVDQLLAAYGIDKQYRGLLRRCLEVLAAQGMLEWRQEQIIVKSKLKMQSASVRQLLDCYPLQSLEINLLKRCGEALADVWQGRTQALSLIFPEDGIDSASQLYREVPVAKLFNAGLCQVIEEVISKWDCSRPLRILEIGAGTGGSTQAVLKSLSNVTVDYIFTDNGGKNSAHYRLKQIDTDGKFEYSPVIYISIPISFSLSQNYPNPFNSFTVIKMKLEEKTDVDFAIYDILGKRVFSQKLKGEIGENRIIFNGKNLASGIYFYEAKGNFGIIKKRMIILK